MSLAAFLTAALESALDNGVATPDDVLRHASPEVLAVHVPRPVWARLIKTCLEAPRVDARLIVETIGVATLCEHVPANVMWGALAEIALRTLGRGLVAAPPSVMAAPPSVIAAPPSVIAASAPATPAALNAALPPVAPRIQTPPRGTAIDASGRVATPPASTVSAAAAAAKANASASSAVASGTPPKGTMQDPAAEITRVAHPPADLSKIASEKSDLRGELTRVATSPKSEQPEPLGEPPAPPPSRGPGATTRANQATQPPATGRRPNAAAGAVVAAGTKVSRGAPPSARRVSTATDFEIETDVNEQWKRAVPPAPGAAGSPGGGSGAIDVPVDDEQLIDWSSSEETATNNDNKYGKR
ncbi:MAG TPA: hypothetical protein VM261_18765 [Kofleriaceae bacterium]|nr:hypothetical protein [Kofleriaceae bacterium]